MTQGYVLWLNLCQIDFQFRLLATSHWLLLLAISHKLSHWWLAKLRLPAHNSDPHVPEIARGTEKAEVHIDRAHFAALRDGIHLRPKSAQNQSIHDTTE